MFPLFKRIVITIPFFVPVAVAVLCTVSVLFLVTGHYDPLLIIAISTLLLLIFGPFIYKTIVTNLKPTRKRLIATIVVLLFCSVWAFANAHYTSQHIYVDRDPGIYASAALWLSDHSSLSIVDESKVFDTATINGAGSGYQYSPFNDELSVQGAHAFPALLGLVGSLFDDSAMLHFNPFIGGAALVAFFGFATLLFKRMRWSVIAVGLLAISLPMIYFSRDSYSEPLALLLVFGGLSFLYFARKSVSVRVWLLAGLIAGASTLTRVDALLSLAGLVGVAFILLNQLEISNKRRIYLSMVYVLSIFAVFALSVYDLYSLAGNYLTNLKGQMLIQVLVFGIIVVVGFGLTLLAPRLGRLYAFVARKWSVISRILIYGMVVIVGILLSRPLWYVGYESREIPHIAGLQAAAGVPVDGFRSYAENSLQWIGWYLSEPLMYLALVGAIAALILVFKTKNIPMLILLFVVGGASAIYLNMPSIVADQIWAARRFLPVIMPGFILLALVVISELFDMKRKTGNALIRFSSGVAVVVMFIGVLTTSLPFLTTRFFDGQLSQVQTVCQSLSPNSALLLTGGYSFVAVQTYRSVCDNVSVGYATSGTVLDEVSVDRINRSVMSKGKELYILSLEKNSPLLQTAGVTTPLSTITFNRIEYTLLRKPQFTITSTLKVYLAKVNAEGDIIPVNQ